MLQVPVEVTSANDVFTISFIHYGDLYSASSRLLLRSATDPCTAKRNSFKARVIVIVNSRFQDRQKSEVAGTSLFTGT